MTDAEYPTIDLEKSKKFQLLSDRDNTVNICNISRGESPSALQMFQGNNQTFETDSCNILQDILDCIDMQSEKEAI